MGHLFPTASHSLDCLSMSALNPVLSITHVVYLGLKPSFFFLSFKEIGLFSKTAPGLLIRFLKCYLSLWRTMAVLNLFLYRKTNVFSRFAFCSTFSSLQFHCFRKARIYSLGSFSKLSAIFNLSGFKFFNILPCTGFKAIF